MSIEATIARIAELHAMLQPAPVRVPDPAPVTTPATSTPSFATMLGRASGMPAVATPGSIGSVGSILVPDGSAGGAIVAAAQGEVGQAEQPPGSNDSPRIAEYRTAVAGAGVGPWCAQFVSWAARQAGAPIGDQGEGMQSVDAVYAWAHRTGRALPAAATPRAGDLIVWDEHIGIVESVLPDGSVQTIEGNSSDQVSRRVHPAGSAVGYVRLG